MTVSTGEDRTTLRRCLHGPTLRDGMGLDILGWAKRTLKVRKSNAESKHSEETWFGS